MHSPYLMRSAGCRAALLHGSEVSLKAVEMGQ
jgi:hypothetical protein